MSTTAKLPHEQRTQWKAFLETHHPVGSPNTFRLMDEFYLVSHQISQLIESSLVEAKVSFPQFRVLMNLYYCEWAGNCDGLNPSEISNRQGTSRNTVSALIRGLENEGLVERHLDTDDRRRFNIQLTEAGRQKIREHTSNHIKTVKMLFDALSTEEAEYLSSTLHKLNDQAQLLKENRAIIDAGEIDATNQ